MTNYSLLKRMTLLAVLGACLLAVSSIQKELNRIKDEEELVIQDKVEDMTPLMAFCTGALGGFRGLIADILFLRLQFLQEKERYFEINELGHLILQLQPDMGEAAAHLGWNMSYNISVKFSSPRDRWRWVRRGIELLRDKAIAYNTTNPVMYHQLGWAYQHKIGQFLDDAHLYYKGQLALQMIEVLGKEKRYDWDRLAAAPDNEDGLKHLLGNRLLKRLLLKDPDAPDEQLELALINLAGQMKTTGKLDPIWQTALEDYNSLDKVEIILGQYNKDGREGLMRASERQFILIGANSDFYRILSENRYILRKLEAEFRKTSDERPTGGLPSPFVEPYERLGLTQILDDYFRSRWLRDVHKIDADFVPTIFERTGYLDFRTPYTHGIYWASVGLKYAPENKKLHRMVQQCLYQSSKWGQLQYVSADGVAVLMPNFDVIDNYFKVFADQPVITRGDEAGAENFLKDNIVILYSWGEEKRANYWFNYLKTKTTLGRGRPYRKKTLEEFVIDLGSGDIADKSQLQTSSMMMGMAVQYLRALAFDERDRADRLIVMLRRIHERYYEELKNKRRKERMRIPTVEELIIQAKYYLMQTAPSPDVAQQIWKVGPDLQKIEEERRRKAQENILDKDENRGMNIQK